jgi:hypothetical protein
VKKQIVIFILVCFIINTLFYFSSVYAVEPKDYRNILYKDDYGKDIFKPTAQLGVKLNNEPELLSYPGTDIGYTTPPLVVIYAKVGDKISIFDHSRSNNGRYIDMWEFQVSTPDGLDAYLTNSATDFISKYSNYTLTKDGVYNIYLCVRDYLSSSEKATYTYNWGNWSENGNHQALGINPGGDGVKGTSDDFQGYWYYTQIRVIVQPDAPTANFSITHNGTDVTDNSTQKINRLTNNLAVNLVDNSSIKSGSIVKREWKYWSTSSGWVKIPGQGTNDTSITVDSAALGISPDRMGFRLTATSDKGMTASAAHDVYSTYASGIASIIVHYKDDKGAALAPDDTIKTDLDKPTTIYSIPIANYKADKASDIVTVPSTDADKKVEYTFIYRYSPATLPPTVSIDSKDSVIMGNDITIKAGGTDPQNNPIYYSWSVSPSSWMQGTLEGTSSTVWFNQVGTVTVTLTGSTSGGSDTDTQNIRVLPPIPQVILDSPLSIGINHKLTVDASKSSSGSQRYAIDWTKTVWEISITDNSQGLTLEDIKTLHPYTVTTNSQGKQVMRIAGDYRQIDILSKKQGKINIYSSLTNTAGYIGFANREVELLPDLAPEIGISVTKETLRDPSDNNLAPIDLIDTSTSPDGDPIGKRVWFYAFDSNNDGSFTDETWYVLDNGIWQPATSYGIDGSYGSLKYLDIDLINDGNQASVLFKADHVGRRMFELIVRESLDSTNSIADFVTTDDMQKSNTFN